MGNQATPAQILEAIAQLQQLSEVFGKRRAQLSRRVGLTEQQWRILEEISHEHFIPSMFARKQESSAAAVSKVLRQLLDKDLIEVSVSSQDGRLREYELSAAGRRTMASLRAYRNEAIDAIWKELPGRELQRFTRFSAMLTERIERYASQEPKD